MMQNLSLHLLRELRSDHAGEMKLVIGSLALGGLDHRCCPALFGRRAVYGTIAGVETFVDQHYQQQIDHIHALGGSEGLLPLPWCWRAASESSPKK